jgi:hypothetical protein
MRMQTLCLVTFRKYVCQSRNEKMIHHIATQLKEIFDLILQLKTLHANHHENTIQERKENQRHQENTLNEPQPVLTKAPMKKYHYVTTRERTGENKTHLRDISNSLQPVFNKTSMKKHHDITI